MSTDADEPVSGEVVRAWLSSPVHKRGPHADAGRDAEACALRADGWSFRQIALRYGVSPTTASRMVDRARQLVPVEGVTRLRDVEGARLDRLMAVQDETIRNPGPLVSAGKIIPGEHDRDVRTRAVVAQTRISEARSRLFGLAAPQRSSVSVELTLSTDWQAKVMELAESVLPPVTPPRQRALLPGELPAPRGGWIPGGPGHDVWKACDVGNCDCHRFDGPRDDQDQGDDQHHD